MFSFKDIRNLFKTKKEKNLNYTAIKDILDKGKKLKQLQIKYLEILRIFLSMKKKKIIISQ